MSSFIGAALPWVGDKVSDLLGLQKDGSLDPQDREREAESGGDDSQGTKKQALKAVGKERVSVGRARVVSSTSSAGCAQKEGPSSSTSMMKGDMTMAPPPSPSSNNPGGSRGAVGTVPNVNLTAPGFARKKRTDSTSSSRNNGSCSSSDQNSSRNSCPPSLPDRLIRSRESPCSSSMNAPRGSLGGGGSDDGFSAAMSDVAHVIARSAASLRASGKSGSKTLSGNASGGVGRGAGSVVEDVLVDGKDCAISHTDYHIDSSGDAEVGRGFAASGASKTHSSHDGIRSSSLTRSANFTPSARETESNAGAPGASYFRSSNGCSSNKSIKNSIKSLGPAAFGLVDPGNGLARSKKRRSDVLGVSSVGGNRKRDPSRAERSASAATVTTAAAAATELAATGTSPTSEARMVTTRSSSPGLHSDGGGVAGRVSQSGQHVHHQHHQRLRTDSNGGESLTCKSPSLSPLLPPVRVVGKVAVTSGGLPPQQRSGVRPIPFHSSLTVSSGSTASSRALQSVSSLAAGETGSTIPTKDRGRCVDDVVDWRRPPTTKGLYPLSSSMSSPAANKPSGTETCTLSSRDHAQWSSRSSVLPRPASSSASHLAQVSGVSPPSEQTLTNHHHTHGPEGSSVYSSRLPAAVGVLLGASRRGGDAGGESGVRRSKRKEGSVRKSWCAKTHRNTEVR